MPTKPLFKKFGFQPVSRRQRYLMTVTEVKLDYPPYSPPRDGRTATIVRGRHGPNYKKYYPVYDSCHRWPQIKPVDPIEFTDREEYR